MAHRILSLDGGVSDVFYLRAMREIELARPGFIARADGFAGVSDGTNAAMLLASVAAETRGLATIDRTIAMTEDILHTITPGLCGWLRLLSLTRAVSNGDAVAEVYARYIGATTRIRDLPGKITVLSYRVRDAAGIQVYQNYGATLGNQLAVEVALESGAFPVVLPVHDGHVDGGLFANNPSAVALAQAAEVGAPWAISLDQITILSLGFNTQRIGGRCVQSAWQKPRADWGLLQWFLYPTDPLLFFQALFNSGDRGSTFQCERFLGPRFLRLAVPSFDGVIGGITEVVLGQLDALIERAKDAVRYWREHPDEASITPSFSETLAWVDRYWMTSAPQPVAYFAE